MEQSVPFSAEDASEVDARVIRDLTVHPGWVNFLQPFLVGCILRMTQDLRDPSRDRAWKRPDNYLRGGIQVAEALLRLPQDILDARDRNANESDKSSGEETYEQHVARVSREARDYVGEGEGISPTDPI